MSALSKYSGFGGSTAPDAVRLAIVSTGKQSDLRRSNLRSVGAAIKFPKRPDLSALNETIPLFYIARNSRGFWVSRSAEGDCGGVFLLRHSAVRFARTGTASAGCALMFLQETLELDIENQGSRVVKPLTSIIDTVWRRAPAVAAFVAMAIVEWHKLVAQVLHAFAGEKRNRAAAERELFHGQYTLTSKNDDDLPVL